MRERKRCRGREAEEERHSKKDSDAGKERKEEKKRDKLRVRRSWMTESVETKSNCINIKEIKISGIVISFDCSLGQTPHLLCLHTQYSAAENCTVLYCTVFCYIFDGRNVCNIIIVSVSEGISKFDSGDLEVIDDIGNDKQSSTSPHTMATDFLIYHFCACDSK